MIKIKFIDTPGHGYYRVNIVDFVESGIDTKIISKYSGVSLCFVYLEEDCDAGRFIEFLKLQDKKHQFSDTYMERREFPTHNYNSEHVEYNYNRLKANEEFDEQV